MRLGNNSLAALARKDIVQPRYDRNTTRAGIVHLGVGAFHRAHQAWYTEAAMNQFGGDWRIIGVSLRRPNMRDALAPQDGLYSLVTRRNELAECQIIGALSDILVAPESPGAVIKALAAADIHVATLTITEKGYGLSGEGELNREQSDIAHDLNTQGAPRSALGFLAQALALRQAKKLPGLSLISCDNLSDNGHKLRNALLQFAELKSAALARWIDAHCRFPNTMVDRIVPATTDLSISEFVDDFGYVDAAPVFTEPFSQWVIERNFAGPVPPWHKVGAQLVDDVAPFEAAKLRTLNASHSLIAYLGCVQGKETVADAMEEASIRASVRGLMHEAEDTFSLPGDFSVNAYQNDLITRFENRALKHRCEQIAMDGSQKIPQRIVPIIEWHLARGSVPHFAYKAIAAWLAFLRSDATIEDPLADQLRQLRDSSAEGAVNALLGMRAIFPAALGDHHEVRSQVYEALRYQLV